MSNRFTLQRTGSVARKELLHILRDPMTLFFTLFIPVVELFMLGYAIDTNVRHVRTVVLDQADTAGEPGAAPALRELGDFKIVGTAITDEELTHAIVAGKARVGIKIPQDYSPAARQARDAAEVLVLVDGSESSVAAEAVNVGNAIALRESLERLWASASAGRVPPAGPLQPRHALGQLLHPRPDGRHVPDDGDHAVGQRHRPREGERHARTALHDAGARR